MAALTLTPAPAPTAPRQWPTATTQAPATTSQTPGPGASSTTSSDRDQVLQDLLRAGGTAQDKVSGGRVISIESERNDGRWEVQVVTADGTEHELDVSADGRTIERGPIKDHDDASDRAEHRRLVDAAKVDYRRVARIMAGAVPQGRITKLGLDDERGRTVWEGDVRINRGAKHEVKIDAATGEVLQNRPDR